MFFGLLAIAAVPVEGAKPFVATISFATGPDLLASCDGFDAIGFASGFLIIHVFFDDQGSPVREVDVANFEVSYRNSLTGNTLSGPSYGPEIIDYQTGTIVFLGLFFIVQSGHGPIVLDAGRLLIDLTNGAVLAANGPKELNSVPLCELLA